MTGARAQLTRGDLSFERPPALQATGPPEARGLARDEVRLLVSSADGHRHLRFTDLPDALQPGDLLVVNRSGTLPASLPARGRWGPFLLNLATRYGRRLWLAEPRWSRTTPGPLSIAPGATAEAGEVAVRFVAPHPGAPRLWFVEAAEDLVRAMAEHGRPITYAYLESEPPIEAYRTVFGDTPGSAEMPSAGRPFSPRVLAALARRGVDIARITLHTGVSSLELDDVLAPGSDDLATLALHAEPFEVPAATAAAVASTRASGGRVIAVGTTVVRALASVTVGTDVRPGRGFTRRVVTPAAPVPIVDGLLTGFHDPATTHLALLHAIASRDVVVDGYREAIAHRYLWHEFGDVQLLLP